MREAAIVSTARTGIGRAYRGYFNATEAPVLAGHVMNAPVERAGIDPARIDDVFWGIGKQWGEQGGNAGRTAIFAGASPQSVSAPSPKKSRRSPSTRRCSTRKASIRAP